MYLTEEMAAQAAHADEMLGIHKMPKLRSMELQHNVETGFTALIAELRLTNMILALMANEEMPVRGGVNYGE